MALHVLGIYYFGHDPAACLLKDGKLVAFVEEERFTRKKHAYKTFPLNTIRFCLNEAKLRMEDIDYITVGWDANKYPEQMRKFYDKSEFKKMKDPATLKWEANSLAYYTPASMKQEIRNNLENGGFSHVPEIRFFNHHLSHAATAFYPSGYRKASILTVDGHGEENCLVGWEGEGGRIKKLFEINMPHSLGWFYAAFTKYLGFEPYDGEGKVMGLAPYGKPDREMKAEMDRIVAVTDEGYRVDPAYIFYGKHSYADRFTDKMVEAFGKPRASGEAINDRHRDIAYAAQEKLEEAMLAVTRRIYNMTKNKNLCIAGGIALNCKMNGYLLRSGYVDSMFPQPISGDGGSALGSALLLSKELLGENRFIMKNVYFGPSYSDDDVERELKGTKGITYKKFRNVEEETARIIADGKIVGWFQGRTEFGPRALGDRSILTDPRKAEMKDIVNNKVKFRETWRPFCPSMTAESAGDYLDNPHTSPYMILSFFVKKDKRGVIPAVVHVDGTARPQTLEKEQNPGFYRLMKEFEKLTGVPVLLNTSFNIRGEPIVCTPKDALNCYLKTGMDVLVMHDYIVRKVR